MLRRRRGAAGAVIFAGLLSAGVIAQERSVPTIELHLAADEPSIRARADLAARESIARYTEWLGPAGRPSFHVAVPPQWSAAPSTMTVEADVAYELARQWIAERDAAGINGIAWYLQGRIVERVFDYRYHLPGYSATGLAFFGGRLAWDVPSLRRSRALVRRRVDEGAWPATTAAVLPLVDRPTRRFALALTSLEHALGWPAVQGAIFEVRRQAATRHLSGPEVEQVISAAIGIDVSPLFAAYASTEETDYRVTALSDRAIEVDRRGIAAPFPVTVRVEFADGQRMDAIWDGRAARTFEFNGASPVIAAHVDPDRVHLLDANLLDNDRRVAPVAANVPIGKWIARWLVWLQDAVLAYSAVL